MQENEALNNNHSYFNKIDNMDGIEFEHLVADLLEIQGFKVEITKGSGDYGVDIIACRGGLKYAVQVKRHNQKISRQAISDAVAGKEYYKCNAAMVVTNNFFSDGAIKLAISSGCDLVDRDTLISWISMSKLINKLAEKTDYSTISKEPQRKYLEDKINGLIELLKIDDFDVNKKAIEELVKIGSPAAVKPLISSINGNNKTFRCKVIITLEKIRDPLALEPLIKILNVPDPDIRGFAAIALGKLGYVRAVEPLLLLLQDNGSLMVCSNFSIKGTLEHLIFLLQDYEVPDSDEESLFFWHSKKDRAVFIRCSRRNDKVRDCAAEALGLIGDSNAVLSLISYINEKDTNFRLRIIQALGNIGDPLALEHLKKIIEKGADNLDNFTAQKVIKNAQRAIEKIIRKNHGLDSNI